MKHDTLSEPHPEFKTAKKYAAEHGFAASPIRVEGQKPYWLVEDGNRRKAFYIASDKKQKSKSAA